MEYIGYFLLAIIGLIILAKIFSWPFRILGKLIINCILGIILLVVVNMVGQFFNFYIGINIWTTLIAGCLGIPGVIFLIIFKLFL